MTAERFTNARVHEWLTPALDEAVQAMRTTRLQLNSAALWWFCRQLTPEQRAHLLGEYVKVQALGGKDPGALDVDVRVIAEEGAGKGREGERPRRRKTTGG